MDFATLYEEDVETWAELQVAALRRLATTPGPWANAIDWKNVIEEIEELGSDRRRAVESLLENAFAHALKIVADPESLSSEQWKKEVRLFLAQARAKISPAMRSRIDMDEIWRNACRQASNALEAFDRRMPETPQQCPYSFDDIVDSTFDLLVKLQIPRPERSQGKRNIRMPKKPQP
jgi:hypothetical protein